MELKQINIEEEYKNLGCKGVNSRQNAKKMISQRKLTSGILKRERTRKASNYCKKENTKEKKENENQQPQISNSIKWDNHSINEQKDYRKKHPLDKEKLKNSMSKYTESVIDKNDVYMKGLNKVNEINPNDEIINKIYNALNGKSNKQKCLKRNKSCLIIGKFKRKNKLKEFYMITEKEKIFDENLGEEQKLTLKNTLFNKIQKEVA
jgi:hypothetical protein